MYYYFYQEESEETPEYQAFVNKFKPKKTTDDCYTSPLIYEPPPNAPPHMFGSCRKEKRKLWRIWERGNDEKA